MKTTILIIGLSVALMGPALGQTNPSVSSAEETNQLPADTLVTKLGTVYDKFHIERVDPSGLTISYIPEGGGIGIEKVPFILLPEAWQKRYGYDPEKAAKFDAEHMRALGQIREQMIAEDNAYRQKRAEQEAAEEAAAEQAKKDAEAVQKAAEIAATLGTNSPAMDTNQLAGTNQPAGTNQAPLQPSGGY